MEGLIGSLVKKLLTLVADPKSSWNGLRWVGVVLAEEVALELKFDNLKKIPLAKILSKKQQISYVKTWIIFVTD